MNGVVLRCGDSLGTTTIAPRTWCHLAAVRTRTRLDVYLNGRLDMSVTSKVRGATDELAIGAQGDTIPLEGKVDEIAVYSRALTAHEIAQHARAGGLEIGDAATKKERAGGESSPSTDPLSPQESLGKTQVREGYRLELVASEPQVVDPVAIDWDLGGRLWIAEMGDYPYGVPTDQKGATSATGRRRSWRSHPRARRSRSRRPVRDVDPLRRWSLVSNRGSALAAGSDCDRRAGHPLPR